MAKDEQGRPERAGGPPNVPGSPLRSEQTELELPSTPRPLPAPAARAFFLVLGWTFAALGAVGVALPLVPTTPFLLLAAACFARSSPALQERLLRGRYFGRYLRQWQREHTVPRDAKIKAFLLIGVTFGVSIAVTDRTWQHVVLVLIGLALVVFLARLPGERRDPEQPDRNGDPLP